MKRELWYCPHCPQNSTRHWNLKTHIKRKHAAKGLPVHRASSSMRAEVDVNFGEINAHEKQRLYYQEQRSSINPTRSRRNDVGDSDPYDTWDKTQEDLDKLLEIKKILSKCFPPQEAHEITKGYWDIYQETQDRSVLDVALAMIGRSARCVDTLEQLSFQGTIRRVPTVTSRIPFSHFGSRTNNSNELSCFGRDANDKNYSDFSDVPEWLKNYKKQSWSTSTTSSESSGILSSSMPSPSLPKQRPPSPTSKYSLPSSSYYRTGVVLSRSHLTQKQGPHNAGEDAFVKNQEYYTDPFYSYFGKSKEKFLTEFFAWQKESFDHRNLVKSQRVIC